VDGVAIGDRVASDPGVLTLPLGTPLLGRAIDAAGEPLDARPAPRGRRFSTEVAVDAVAERRPCTAVFETGVRAIDGPLAFGRGARIGIFGAPGAGKSTLLDAIVRGASADAVVVGLIGERGREAERRLARLCPRTTLVCATSERAAAERVRAAEVAFAQACALRARGLDVLLVVDSLARIAAAAREVALAAGEPAGRGGYPPSVFASLARLLERAGPTARGSVTLVATVLSDGPDEHDPVSEAARAALDGHLVLAARLARAGRFPAIDLVRSTSRTLADVATPEHAEAARIVRAAVAALDESRDARALGVTASDLFLARCVAHEAALERFLRQGPEPSRFGETLTALRALADSLT
ncbi:MAG TPA: EscN/YscN/HrcN family type III secretion system ATPase, partial [Candidatus Elarobacter sp.]|nr:EscN/YscN/HrcN family type III secretion system ATPase [Candidatus Elarobacter sp.]